MLNNLGRRRYLDPINDIFPKSHRVSRGYHGFLEIVEMAGKRWDSKPIHPAIVQFKFIPL